jgi:hypothetical protein
MKEGSGQIWIKDGDIVIAKSYSISWSSEKEEPRSASFQVTQSKKLARLNKVICLYEYETDMNDNSRKIWEWK